MTATNTAMTKPENTAPVNSKKLIKEWLEGDEFKSAIQKSLPKHITPDRFIRIAINAMTKQPKLALCDQKSFMNACMTLTQFGLEPDGRRAHLIPFWNTKQKCNEVQLVIDYKGLAELAQRSGMLAKPPLACIVCENDDFSWDTGSIRHKIDFRKPRGEMYAVYSMVETKGGGVSFDVMTREEVDRVRARSKSKDSGPWVTDYEEMAKKTVFRRHSKMLVLSPEFMDAVEKDDESNFETKFANVVDVKTTPIFGDRRPAAQIDQPAQEQEPQPSDDDVPMDFQNESRPPQAAAAPVQQAAPKTERIQKSKAPADSLFPTEPNTLEKAMLSAGVTFDEFQAWAVDQGYDNIGEVTSFAEVSKRQVDLLTNVAATIISDIAGKRGAK